MSIVSVARLAVVSGIAACAAGAAHADAFMKMTGAPGDVTLKGLEQQVALIGASFNVMTVPQFDENGEQNGRATQAGPVMLTKAPDRSSPKLMLAAMQNQDVGDIEITFTAPRVPGNPVTMQYKWILEGVRVNAFSVYPGASAGETPVETIEVSYKSLRYQYFPVDPRTGKSSSSEEVVIDAPDGQTFGESYIAGCG